jgi:uncharacterized DUF497 family protein
MTHYVWDNKKAEANYRKHGVTFGEATEVFSDPNAVIQPDPYREEERFRITGWTQRNPKELLVVFVDRSTTPSEEIYRIVSARRLSPKEKAIMERVRRRKST